MVYALAENILQVLADVRCEDQYSPQQFARLLVRSIDPGNAKESWSSIFPIIYGKSVEELCAEFENKVDFYTFL